MNSSSPGGIADGVKTKTTSPSGSSSPCHDRVDTGPDAARAQLSAVMRSLAEDALLDQHGEPGRAQGLLQARDVLAALDVLALVPGHDGSSRRCAVHRERGRADVHRSGTAAAGLHSGRFPGGPGAVRRRLATRRPPCASARDRTPAADGGPPHGRHCPLPRADRAGADHPDQFRLQPVLESAGRRPRLAWLMT